MSSVNPFIDDTSSAGFSGELQIHPHTTRPEDRILSGEVKLETVHNIGQQCFIFRNVHEEALEQFTPEQLETLIAA